MDKGESGSKLKRQRLLSAARSWQGATVLKKKKDIHCIINCIYRIFNCVWALRSSKIKQNKLGGDKKSHAIDPSVGV